MATSASAKVGIISMGAYDDGTNDFYPSVDERYGPYSSVEEALTSLTKEGNASARMGRAIGLKVGILAVTSRDEEGYPIGTIEEYWFQGGVEDDNLVKVEQGGGGTITAIKSKSGEEFEPDDEGVVEIPNASRNDYGLVTFGEAKVTQGNKEFYCVTDANGKLVADIPVASNTKHGVVQASEASITSGNVQANTYVSDGKMYADLPKASQTVDGVVKMGSLSFAGLTDTSKFQKYPIVVNGSGNIEANIPPVSDIGTDKGNYGGVLPRAYFDKFMSAYNKVDQGGAFSESKTYEVGDIVVYHSVTYQFTQRHPAGVWNPYHVEQINGFKSIKDECLELVRAELQQLDTYLGTILNG